MTDENRLIKKYLKFYNKEVKYLSDASMKLSTFFMELGKDDNLINDTIWIMETKKQLATLLEISNRIMNFDQSIVPMKLLTAHNSLYIAAEKVVNAVKLYQQSIDEKDSKKLNLGTVEIKIAAALLEKSGNAVSKIAV